MNRTLSLMDLPGYEPVFDEPEQVRALFKRHAPYPAIAGYQSDRVHIADSPIDETSSPAEQAAFPWFISLSVSPTLTGRDRQAADHVCEPVLAGSADSLVQHKPSGIFIVTQLAPDERFDGPPGF